MTLTVHQDARGYTVTVERGLLARAGTYLFPIARRWAVVSDETVAALYGDTLLRALADVGLTGQLFTVPAGEGSKCLTRYERLCAALYEAGFTRSDGVLALGGGMVGDLAGFVAATYRRGLPLVQMPTTLLAQVDSAVGGKTGLDLPWGKNQIGAFYRPRAVLIDPSLLDTLPRRQICSGMAEVIKYGFIADPAILDMLDDPADRDALIARCLAVKIALVEQDEFDRGQRHLLNFGHTYGHAYEALGGYERYTHGEAVAAGMARMLRWQAARGEDVSAACARLLPLLETWELPAVMPYDGAALAPWLRGDKKADGGAVEIVVLEEVGRAALRRVRPEELWEVSP